MLPSKRPRGRQRKKLKATKDQDLRERSQAPSPSPSRTRHSNAHIGPSDAGMPQMDATADLSEVVMPPADAEIVRGYAREEMWDSKSDTGMKPMQLGGYASDESMEVDEMLPEGADVGIQGAMADLIV